MEQSAAASPTSVEDVDEEKLLAKMIRRIVPFLFVCYVVSYLDRVNVGFAALTMNKDIGFTPTAFGIGCGAVFHWLLYCRDPEQPLMMKVGARSGSPGS